jgi:hypothetical protein
MVAAGTGNEAAANTHAAAAAAAAETAEWPMAPDLDSLLQDDYRSSACKTFVGDGGHYDHETLDLILDLDLDLDLKSFVDREIACQDRGTTEA